MARELLEAPLDEVLAEARRLRDEGHGRLVTYSPKVFIPLTKLCRDVCHYCTFAKPPRRGQRAYMTIDEVLDVARAGAAAGCREALFTLGDKPELRYRVARDELAALGCSSTLEYLARAAKAVLDETGLLPHLNPGVLTREDLELLRPVAPSMGIMLETTSRRLGERGGPHFGSPDKEPAARLETIRLAGEARIPFTTGILIGIGETRAERLEALAAIKDLGDRHGHLQEVIVQNFRAKQGTRMAAAPEPSLEELLWTIAAARVLLAAEWSIQAPPNLTDDFPRLLDAGIDDWGGVSPVTIDHVNPEAPWPELELLRAGDREPRPRARPAAHRLSGLHRRRVDRPCGDAAVLRASDSLGLAREDAWSPGETWVCRSSPRDALPVDTHDELGEDELVRLFRARGDRARARLRGGRPAAARGQRRHRHLRRDAEHPVHERLLLPLRLLRFLEGQARREPARRALPRAARGDRAARRRGMGARRDGDLPAGRNPPGLRRRLLPLGRPRRQGRGA